MDKEKLSKLASLNDKKANKFLLEFALDKKNEIKNSTTNEEIISLLGYFEAFFYRTPKVVSDICKYILYDAKPLKAAILFKNVRGEPWERVQIKTLELLKQIRYYKLKEAIEIGFNFSNNKDQAVKSTAIKLIQEITTYNHQALPHVGLTPQILTLKYLIKDVSKLNFENNFNPVKVSIEHILETSADSTIMTGPDTISFRKGDLVGNDNLSSLRRKAIDLTFTIYKKSKSGTIKNEVVQLFQQACRMPENSPKDSDIAHIVYKDREYIISRISKILFDKKGNIHAPLSFCMQIEHFLYWYFIFHKQQDEVARPLYEKLNKDPFYNKFSRFVQDGSSKHELGFKESEIQNRLYVEEYIQNANVDRIAEIENELNLFTKEVDSIGEWKFRNLQNLFERLGSVKPDIAFGISKNAIKKRTTVSHPMFLSFLLRGIRVSKRYELWDSLVTLLAKTKNTDLLRNVPASIYIYADIQHGPILRRKDVDLMTDLVNKRGLFTFLESTKQNINLNYNIMNALRAVYNLQRKKIENLIILEIKKNPSYTKGYLNILSIFSTKEGGIDFSKWSEKNKKFISDKIVEIPDLDWHLDTLISSLYSDPLRIIQLFINRIKQETRLNKSIIDYFSRTERYEAIPFHMNDSLINTVVAHKDYNKIIPEIIKAANIKNTSKYNLSKLIKHFKVSSELVIEALGKGKKVTDFIVRKMIQLTADFDGISAELAVKLASYTSNEKILNEIRGALHSTGVVSGQYGIANAYKAKADDLEKYKDDNNENIRKFIEMSIASLRNSAERAKKDADEDKEKRRVDFEINS